MSDSPIRVTRSADGAICTLELARPKANVLDSAMVEALGEALVRLRDARDLKALVFSAEGDHFSFGASVQEHLPASVASMLSGFHGMFRAIAALSVPTFAVVRGRCLGGGLELASFCHRVFAAPGALLGQPEIQLGVFAPVASACLPERVGRAAADHLCTTGVVIPADEALRIGLVDEVSEAPMEAAIAHVERHLLPLSASSIRLAARAVRADFEERFFVRLDTLERLYLDELMVTADAVEGIEAFIDKRKAVWSNA